MGNWKEMEVAGSAADVFEPNAASEHGYSVIYLHGVHQQRLVDHPAFAEQFDRFGLRVLCPHTGESWWTDRIYPEFDPEVTAEQHVLQRVLGWMAEHWSVAPPRIGLLGTSMGGQGALRLAYKHPRTFPVVAAISPAIDYHQRLAAGDAALASMYRDAEAARQDTATLHVHPLNWPRCQWFACDPADVQWFESADRLRMKLAALGVPYEADLETSAGGHSFDYYSHMAPRAVEFILRGLQQEELRVL